MISNSPNSLSSLTHTTHTDLPDSHAVPGETDDDEGLHSGVAALEIHEELESPTRIEEEFDFDGFYTLAARVLNEDTISMATLNSLKDRWDQKFKMRKGSPVAAQEPNTRILKPVAGRIGTPFRSRVSLLPRRNLSGMPLPEMATPNQLDEGVQQLILDNQGCSSQLPLDSYYDQENLLGKVTVLTAVEESNPIDGDVGSSKLMGNQDVALNRIVNSEHAGCSFTLDSTPLMNSVHDNLRVEGGRGAGSSGLTETHDSTAVDNIAGAFLNSSQKTLHFVPPTKQNGEIIVRPTKEVVENGSKKWHATTVGFRHGCHGRDYRRGSLAIPRSTYSAAVLGASGVGTPLYTDGITKECSRHDFARVCVMLNYNSTLPKHLIVISPILRDGKEDPKRVDIEYEWLPQRSKLCCSLGHVASTCPDSKKTNQGPPITIFVKKQSSNSGPAQPERGTEVELTVAGSKSTVSAGYVPVRSTQPVGKTLELTSSKGKDIAIYNSYGVLASVSLDNTVIEFDDANQLPGPITRSPTVGPP
ncbi:hypothetical protein Sango_2744100 [Sesamum angolense]|uniref:Uncharacterized protein n=1 Tax=Sesamum angolense TaxID=2727404 RepID=A0AAE1T8U4_9LAMI|nr:hypothetical protein Sango_2744100 [Sesamum angolense]